MLTATSKKSLITPSYCAILLVIMSTLGILMTSCGDSQTPLQKYKLENIGRIFMADPGSYILMYQDVNETIVKVVDLRNYKSTLITDVPKDMQMWMEYDSYFGKLEQQLYNVKIHIHDVKDVNGAEWHHGKGSHDQLIPIE